ncbi:MAG: beta strand repeat-containing protein [Patescibacteria group bacterium]
MNFIRKKQEGQNRAKFLVIGIFFVLFFTVFYFINQVSVAANPPNIITYQGKLLNNGSAVTTTQNIQFILCSDASCTTKLYTAGGTLASPTTINITPTNGIFSIDLGGSGTNALDPIIFKNNSNIYLEVTVNGEILLPRRQITAIPYAYNAKYLDGVGTATVSSSTYIPVSASDGSFNFTTTTISTSTITQADITNLNISGTISGLSSTQLSDTANLVRLNANNTFTGLNNFATGTFSAFRLGTSATSGYVLTTDANGYGTWKEIISGGSSISSLNGLTNATQTFSTSTSGGLLFDISSVGSNHTFTLGLANNYFIPLVASTTYWNTNANLVNDNYTNWNNAYQIVNTSSTLWDTAYNWGDHSTKGYLTSFAETDPLWSAVSTSLTVANFASNNISQWTNNVGYITSTSTDTLINKSGLISMWTNDRNYLTSYDETDPLWSAASSSYVRWDAASTTYWNTNANLVNDNYTNWNNAYQIVNTSSTLWDTAYNWGDHSTKGYLTSFAETDPLWSAVSTSLTVANFASNNISQWTNNVGYITSTSTDTLINKSGLISMWTNDRNYLTSFDETDPLWSAASSSYVRWDAASTTYWNTNANLVNDNYTNWNNAYQIVNTSSTLWDTAYNWGDHSTKGYLTSFAETDPLWSAVSTSLTVANFASNNISQWTNNVGYITSTSTDTLINKSGLISMWTNDRNYLTSYDETDPLWSAASSSYVRWDAASTTYWNTNANLVNDNYTNWNNAYQIVNTSSTLWDTAYNWGDHSTKGYLTSFDETDPLWSAVSTSLTVANFASNNISQWTNNVGYITSTSTDTLINKSGLISMWTNDRNYLTSYDETDPLWSAASSSYVRWDAASTTYWNTNANLVNDNYTNWNNAYQIVNTSSTLWDTAYNWGDHSTKGYLTSFAETDPLWSAVSTSLTVANFASNNISQWTNNVGYITSTSTDTLINKSGLISMWTNDRNYLTSYDETDPLWSAASSSYALLAGNNTFTGLNNFATTIINGDLNVTGNTTLATTTLNGTLLSKNGLFTSGVENKVTISEVVFSDPGFESWETSATPTYWGKMAFSPSGSVTQESTVVHGGSYSAKITAGATVDDKIFIYNNSPIQLTGDTFNFSYWVKNGTGKVGVALLNAMDGDYMKAYNFTGDNQDQWTDFVNDWLTSDQYVETDASDWTYVEHNNISISDTGELYIILISPQGAGAVGTYGYIDDLSVKENILTDVDSFIFDTQNIISSNKYLFNIKNNGTSTLALTGDGRLQVNNLILNQGTFNSKVEQIGTNLSDELLDDPELDVWDTYYSPSDWNIHKTNNYLFELRESTQKRSGNYALKMSYYRDPVTNKEDSVIISKKLSDLTINNHLNFSGYAKTTDDWGELRVYLYYEDKGNYYFYNFSGGAQGNWTISNNGEWPNNDNQRKVFGMSSSTGFNNLDFSNIPIPRNSITVKFHQGGTIYIDDFSLKDSVTSEEFFINGGFENWAPVEALS